jgi:toxin-antitoxin system PIN domain toxin
LSYLLDINVLIARVDPAHAFHVQTLAWMSANSTETIATCPLTENGFCRIYGHPSYPGGPGSTDAALQDLRVIRLLPNHRFIPDSVTIADNQIIPTLAGSTPKHLTDLYLLALAGAHGLTLATFNARIPTHLVSDGLRFLTVIPT